MKDARSEQLNRFLGYIADDLDIPESLYREAAEKYEEVGRWLSTTGSRAAQLNPQIYPQGSFRLGTMVKPISDEDEYDVDLVCQLQIKKERITQANLKRWIGDRLRMSPKYAAMLEEGRRCWTLDFERHFHMDILPAIPDLDAGFGSILITDKELLRWQHSNPKGYAEWFSERMKVAFRESRQALAKSEQINIEDVPEWRVRTPLQRVVQLLKRNRDIHFNNDQDDKPISIIITTLAAKSYRNQLNLYDAMREVVYGMPKHIEERNGVCWIPNPVNLKENFADKWQEHPIRQKKFFAWLAQVQVDFEAITEHDGIASISKELQNTYGKSTTTRAAERYGEAFRKQREHGNLYMTPQSGILGVSSGIIVRKHKFFG